MITVLVLILLVVCIGMPLGYAWRIWRLDEPARIAWLAVAAEASVFVLLVLLVGRWDIAGYYLRFVLLALFAAAVLASWRRHAGRPWRAPEAPPLRRSHPGTLVSLVLFCAALVYVAAGLRAGPAPRDLAFPLQDGWFVIGQGGDNRLLNHHSAHPAQRHAADITALYPAGFRAAGLLPADPARYAAFGATVVSPCAGEVVAARDDLPDLRPPTSDRDNPAGNHAVIACEGMLVELAHLRQGSLAVGAGDRVAGGTPIGEVGNSGNTTEPHLHVHATDAATGEGVAITFDGVAPVRNRSFHRRTRRLPGCQRAI